MSRYDKYSENALSVLIKTQDISLQGQTASPGSRELAHALVLFDMQDMIAIARGNNMIVDAARVQSLNESLGTTPGVQPGTLIALSPEFRSILDKAEALAGDAQVEPAHLLKAAWPAIKSELAPFFRPQAAPDLAIPADELDLPEIGPAPVVADAFETLGKFCRELTRPGAAMPVYARTEEIGALVTILLKRYKPNPLIVGESGVGKTSLVHGLAHRIMAGDVPARLAPVRIFELDMAEVLAGTTLHGALEENLTRLLDALESVPDSCLFIDDFHQVVPSFANNPVSEVLKPALSSGRIRCIGAVTMADYQRHIEKDSALARRFHTLVLKEPAGPELEAIVDGVTPSLEQHFGMPISARMRRRSIDIARRYLPSKRFPDKALDVLDRAGARALYAGDLTLQEPRLFDAVREIGGVVVDPALDVDRGMPGLEAAIGRHVLRQEPAIAMVAEAVRVARMRLESRMDRPSGAFLLTGPTGVGKTAVAEHLARALSGRDDALFRLDMSEFSDAHTAARLLGAPPGYIGYDDTPLLTRAIETCQGGVLLLDEFEKAHPSVHRLFLQILDAGRATDSSGRQLSFSGLTILATCNVGNDGAATVGFSSASLPGQAGVVPMAALRRVFPLELLNRFDALVPFRQLGPDDAATILAEVIVRDANLNLEREYGVTLVLEPRASDFLVARGYSAEFGVRNMQRAWRTYVLVPLSRLLGEGTLSGRIVVSVSASDAEPAALRFGSETALTE